MTSGAPGGSGGSVNAVPFGPYEGQAGIGSWVTDNNMTGVLLYDNSGLPGNPLNSVFINSSQGANAYFEPGLPVIPWGHALGVKVSG